MEIKLFNIKPWQCQEVMHTNWIDYKVKFNIDHFDISIEPILTKANKTLFQYIVSLKFETINMKKWGSLQI